jgi:hypothetical protein
VVSFKPRPLYLRYALDRRLGGLRAVLYAVVKRKKIPAPAPAGNRNPAVQPVASSPYSLTARCFSLDTPSTEHIFIMILLWNLSSAHFQHSARISQVSTKTGLRAGRAGYNSRQATASRRTLGPTQLPIQWVRRVLSPGVKRQRRETHHSPPSSAEVKNAWSCNTDHFTFPKGSRIY